MNIETASRLFEYRKKFGLSQEELAEKLGISRQAISKWERAEASPDTDNLIALSRLYNVTLDELLNYSPEINEELKNSDKKTEQNDESKAEKLNNIRIQNNINDPSVRANIYDNIIDKSIKRSDNKWGIKIALDGAFPIIIVLIYLIIGFKLHFWHPGWLIFLTIPLYYGGAEAIKSKKINHFPFPILITLIYLYVSFTWGNWGETWLMFFTIPIFYTLFK